MTLQITETAVQPRHLLRSAGAIVAGFATVVVLSTATDLVFHALGVFPPDGQPMYDPALNALALAYRTLFTIAGGYVTAWLAPSRPIAHAVVLGAIGTAAGAAGVVVMGAMGLLWYSVGLAVLALPSTWFGGWLHSKR